MLARDCLKINGLSLISPIPDLYTVVNGGSVAHYHVFTFHKIAKDKRHKGKGKREKGKVKNKVNECRAALVKNSFQENFYITFMRNKKSYQNINCFFFFFHKNFL